MLNLTSLTTIPTLAKIATDVQSYKLFIITDGSYDYMTRQGSQAIAITNSKELLWLGAGPCLSNGIAMNPKRSELCGLASALYLALWICLDQKIHYGSITFLCNSKCTVNTLRDISQCLPLKHPTNDIDLALECRTIIKNLHIKTYYNWLPGHKKSDDVLSKIQRDVHTDAKSHNKITSPSPTVLPPSYEIAIGMQRKIIPTNLKGIVNQVAHETEIRNTIMKNTGWTIQQFHDIDWRAHQKVFCSIGRFRQISICKIIHGLLCTNDKQKRYYGKRDLCPCCGSSTETMNHMLCGPSQYATEFRVKAQQELESELQQINTPEPILSAVLFGASQFEELTNRNKHERPTTRGSILPMDVLATHCITTQGALAWDQFLRGRTLISWRKFFTHFKQSAESHGEIWTKKLIMVLWNYTTSIWKHRNNKVHGATIEDQKKKEKEELGTQVRAAYEDYTEDKFLIPRSMSYLFERHSLENKLKEDRDTLRCWIKSVEEAKQIQNISMDRMRRNAEQFFTTKEESNNKQYILEPSWDDNSLIGQRIGIRFN
jgi:hypothetical protein